MCAQTPEALARNAQNSQSLLGLLRHIQGDPGANAERSTTPSRTPPMWHAPGAQGHVAAYEHPELAQARPQRQTPSFPPQSGLKPAPAQQEPNVATGLLLAQLLGSPMPTKQAD